MEQRATPGNYVNPGNGMFARARSEDIFVDKTGLIQFTNRLLGKARNKICVTRPRRFGKTRAFDMLAAYYSCSCDSTALFQGLKIAQSAGFQEHLNRHNVIRLNIQGIWEMAGDRDGQSQLIPYLQQEVIRELIPLFPDAITPKDTQLSEVLIAIYKQYPGTKFIFLIDEWDVLFRSCNATDQLKADYLNLLKGLFNDSKLDACIDLVYLTGILPIPHIPGQASLSGFAEYSMLRPDALAEYVGFTESEVADLCEQWNIPLDLIQNWYDGYPLPGLGSIYCPESIVQALTRRIPRGYWAATSTYLLVRDYISLDFPGLKEAVDSLIAGEPVGVNAASFTNDPNAVYSADDVLTLLVHYGYLSYQPKEAPWKDGMVHIPNREAREQFRLAARAVPHSQGIQ